MFRKKYCDITSPTFVSNYVDLLVMKFHISTSHLGAYEHGTFLFLLLSLTRAKQESGEKATRWSLLCACIC